MNQPFVRVRCADYGDEWVVECDVFGADDHEPHTSGPYRFATEQEAQSFIETLARAVA